MKKALPLILLLLLATAALVVKRCRNRQSSPAAKGSSIDRNRDFDRRGDFLEFTPHADCRMKCLQVSKETVKQLLLTGVIDSAHSDLAARPCPVYALQADGPGKHKIRVMFAQCDTKTKVVTCVYPDSAADCSCAGVGSRYDHADNPVQP